MEIRGTLFSGGGSVFWAVREAWKYIMCRVTLMVPGKTRAQRDGLVNIRYYDLTLNKQVDETLFLLSRGQLTQQLV